MAPIAAEGKVEKKVKARKPKVEKKVKTKRARSAYILYSMDIRSTVVKENPELEPKNVMKKIAEMWKASDEATKQKYKERSAKEKEALASAAADAPASEES